MATQTRPTPHTLVTSLAKRFGLFGLFIFSLSIAGFAFRHGTESLSREEISEYSRPSGGVAIVSSRPGAVTDADIFFDSDEGDTSQLNVIRVTGSIEWPQTAETVDGIDSPQKTAAGPTTNPGHTGEQQERGDQTRSREEERRSRQPVARIDRAPVERGGEIALILWGSARVSRSGIGSSGADTSLTEVPFDPVGGCAEEPTRVVQLIRIQPPGPGALPFFNVTLELSFPIPALTQGSDTIVNLPSVTRSVQLVSGDFGRQILAEQPHCVLHSVETWNQYDYVTIWEDIHPSSAISVFGPDLNPGLRVAYSQPPSRNGLLEWSVTRTKSFHVTYVLTSPVEASRRSAWLFLAGALAGFSGGVLLELFKRKTSLHLRQ